MRDEFCNASGSCQGVLINSSKGLYADKDTDKVKGLLNWRILRQSMEMMKKY